MTRSPWPAVVVVVVGVAAVVVLAVTHSASDTTLAWLSAAILPTAASLLVGAQLGHQVSDVKEQVNGNLGKLIDAALTATAAASNAGPNREAPAPTSSPEETLRNAAVPGDPP